MNVYIYCLSMQVAIGARNEVYMVMEYVEHDLKYVLELQHKKKAPQFSIGQVGLFADILT